MSRDTAHVEIWLLGGLFLAALVIGGGTAPQLVTDSLLQMLTISICTAVLVMQRATPIDLRLIALPALAILLILMQMTPLPIAVARTIWPSAVQEAWAVAQSPARFGFISLGVSKTLSVLLYFISLTLLLWALAGLKYSHLVSLARIVALGIGVNMLMALMQMSAGRGVSGVDVGFPYLLRIGVFTNANHFSTMMMMIIPPLIYWAYQGNKILGFTGLAVVWALLFGANSIAGILGGLAIALLAFNQFADQRLLKLFSLPVMAIVAVVFVMGAYGSLMKLSTDTDLGRLDFYKTTLIGIRQSPIFGTGFGTFVQTYQIYESAKDIYVEYVNHAHNDYLELLLEGGVLAGALLVLYFVIILWQVYRNRTSPIARVAILSIIAVLVHSLVDYPLRTMADAFLFVLAHAFLFVPAETVLHASLRDHRHRKHRQRSDSAGAQDALAHTGGAGHQ